MHYLSLGLALGLVVAACGGDEEPTFPEGAFAIRANIDIAEGAERLLVGIRASDGAVLGGPDTPVVLEVSPVDAPDAEQQSVAAEFSWIVPDATGLYRGTFEFDRAGVWQVVVVPESGPPLEPALFSVLEPSCADPDAAERGLPTCSVQVGEDAPIVASPTLDDNPIETITTDPDPDPRLYELSLDTAITNGRPTVVVFATPAFCQTAACGPLVDVVQEAIDDHPEADFVHVEVYTGFREEGFDPSDPDRLAPAIIEYRLVNEPWVYVVGPDGVVESRFEGVMDREELEEALGALS
jgi:hypothetical protein